VNQDQTFRLVLIAGALIVLPVMVYHRLRSQATGEKLDRWQEGLFILFTLRAVGITTMLGLIGYMINPAWMAWSSVSLPAWLRWAGVGLGVIAGGLLIWTLRNLGRNLTDTVVTRRAHTLVSSGPYRWVRHPFYDAVALCISANALTAANWFLFLMGALTVVLLVVRTRTEEEKLLLRFGEAYGSYAERTGRFLPRRLSTAPQRGAYWPE
jgi:protein-S-isoprenylcysteine O-methyltransferase Ste14